MPNKCVVLEAEAPDHCFAPEPKPQEFQKGDLIRALMHYPAKHKEFLCVTNPNYSYRSICAVDGNEKEWAIGKDAAELVEHSPIKPKGPICVGSTVSRKQGGGRGIVSDTTVPSAFVSWGTGFQGWYLRDELIHIASPKDH